MPGSLPVSSILSYTITSLSKVNIGCHTGTQLILQSRQVIEGHFDSVGQDIPVSFIGRFLGGKIRFLIDSHHLSLIRILSPNFQLSNLNPY